MKKLIIFSLSFFFYFYNFNSSFFAQEDFDILNPKTEQKCQSKNDAEIHQYIFTKGYQEDEFEKIKNEINDINKSIQVGDNPEKTWKVYTKPILKRKNIYFVKNDQGVIVGYAALKNDEPYLSWIAIKEDYRGREKGNLAKKLILEIMKDYSFITLDVRESNTKAIKFYESLSEFFSVEKEEGHEFKNNDKGFVFKIKRK